MLATFYNSAKVFIKNVCQRCSSGMFIWKVHLECSSGLFILVHLFKQSKLSLTLISSSISSYSLPILPKNLNLILTKLELGTTQPQLVLHYFQINYLGKVNKC